MKKGLRKQNLRLNICLKKGQHISNLLSYKNVVEDIDDEYYHISLDLTKNKELNAHHYEMINSGVEAIEYIEIDDNYAIKNFKDYYISRYSNNKRVYLKNVIVNLIMGQTKTIKCKCRGRKGVEALHRYLNAPHLINI